jgi:2-methylcitrate dehydratase PrpD
VADSTLAQQLARFAVGCTFDSLPDDIVDGARKRVLDVLGICVAALPLGTSRAALGYVADQGGREQATAVGLAQRLPAPLAAFANGVLAHSLDYDDTHLPSVLHPSASVVPAALATAEATGADGRAVIAAIAAGLEVCVRVGMAGFDPQARTSVFFENGQHATSIAGALGGAVAAGLLLGMDADRIVDVLGIAASMGSGIIEANRTGGTVKRMHCGWAAQSAISAAELVRHGFTGPPTVFEGRFGFFQAWLHGEVNSAAMTDGLGSTWASRNIFFKPYPANHFLHAAIDAAIAVRERGVRPGQVASAVLGVAAPTVRTVGEPAEAKRTPATGYMAQFSGPYAVTVGLLGGHGLGAGLADFTDELARDPRRRELMARVSVVADAKCTEIFPDQFPATLQVTLADGGQVAEEVLTNRGGPGRELSYEELATKFRDNAASSLGLPVIDTIQASVASLEQLPGMRSLLSLLTPLAQIRTATGAGHDDGRRP